MKAVNEIVVNRKKNNLQITLDKSKMETYENDRVISTRYSELFICSTCIVSLDHTNSNYYEH